jgi:predicted small lipoprotein YifL
MKKLVSLIIALALAVSLTACADNGKTQEPAQNTASDTAQTPVQTDNSNNNTEDSANGGGNSGASEDGNADLLAAIEEFPMDEFVGLDGKTVSKTQATEFAGNALIFDFGYVREPTLDYLTTLETPDLFNFETTEFKEGLKFETNGNYIKAEKGDIINGFEVEAASFAVMAMNYDDGEGNEWQDIAVVECAVVFTGEQTINGVLYRLPTDADYIDVGGDLLFYPNADSSSFFPLPYSIFPMPMRIFDETSEFALFGDTARVYMGNVRDFPEVEELYENSDYIQAEVTLTNLAIIYNEAGGGVSSAELLNVKAVK